MRTETIKIYTYDEISDSAKEKAKDWYRQAVLDYDWWDCIYEDAENIDCQILSFDCDRGEIDFHAIGTFEGIAAQIRANHGTKCETYKIAMEYEDNILDNAGFIRALSQDYLAMLGREYEYLNSDEAVEESILANEYEFTEQGERY